MSIVQTYLATKSKKLKKKKKITAETFFLFSLLGRCFLIAMHEVFHMHTHEVLELLVSDTAILTRKIVTNSQDRPKRPGLQHENFTCSSGDLLSRR